MILIVCMTAMMYFEALARGSKLDTCRSSPMLKDDLATTFLLRIFSSSWPFVFLGWWQSVSKVERDPTHGNQFFFPSLDVIKKYKIVICTLTSSGR